MSTYSIGEMKYSFQSIGRLRQSRRCSLEVTGPRSPRETTFSRRWSTCNSKSSTEPPTGLTTKYSGRTEIESPDPIQRVLFPSSLLRDVSPMVDQENNVLQYFLSSDLVSLGLWGNVVAKNLRVKGTNFESLGFGFELPADLIGNVFAVRVMRVEYDHYSKICRSYKIPPQ